MDYPWNVEEILKIFEEFKDSLLFFTLFELFYLAQVVPLPTTIASYADDSTLFIVKNDIDNIIATLERISVAVFNWFKNNCA